jgi:hypothetical protein
MVRNRPSFRSGGLTGPRIHAPVDLHGIGDDDLSSGESGYR